MQKFCLEGFYHYVGAPDGKGDLAGIIEVANDGSFDGEVCDYASVVPAQLIRGFLLREKVVTKLLFLKFPPADDLANLVYVLQKPFGQSFEGKYSGEWGALPFKIGFSPDNGLALASIDMSVCGIGDYAEIELYKK